MKKKPRRRTPSEAAWFDLPSDWWERFDDLVNDVLEIPLKAFFNKGTGISERHLRRSKEPCKISKNSLRKLASAFGYGNNWRTMLEKLGGKPPPMPASAQLYFRDINPKTWQPILPAERPHPHPPDAIDSPPPFQHNLGGDVCFVAGWNLRLQANMHYRVTCDFVRNNVWPEVEIVLYERVLHTEMWKRADSFGAITSGKRSADVTSQVEEWLITAWGKNVIADNAPWFYFVPVPKFDLDVIAGLLKLPFSAPNLNRQESEGELPVSKLSVESSPAVRMQIVD
jgi:hypothetical protein